MAKFVWPPVTKALDERVQADRRRPRRPPTSAKTELVQSPSVASTRKSPSCPQRAPTEVRGRCRAPGFPADRTKRAAKGRAASSPRRRSSPLPRTKPQPESAQRAQVNQLRDQVAVLAVARVPSSILRQAKSNAGKSTPTCSTNLKNGAALSHEPRIALIDRTPLTGPQAAFKTAQLESRSWPSWQPSRGPGADALFKASVRAGRRRSGRPGGLARTQVAGNEQVRQFPVNAKVTAAQVVDLITSQCRRVSLGDSREELRLRLLADNEPPRRSLPEIASLFARAASMPARTACSRRHDRTSAYPARREQQLRRHPGDARSEALRQQGATRASVSVASGAHRRRPSISGR